MNSNITQQRYIFHAKLDKAKHVELTPPPKKNTSITFIPHPLV